MALWYMVPAALASEGARFARLPAGGVSALAPAPSIKLGCVLDASTCRLKKREKAVEVKGPIPQGRSKVYRVFCSASARERPARRRRAGRNRRRRRIIIKRTMPKPRFSPKMKHDSCHYQYIGRTNGNKCPVRVLVLRQLGRSASQAVSHATERLAASSLSARASGRQEASGASHA